MKNLASSHFSAQIFLKEERFTVSLTGKPHSKIPTDPVIGMTIIRSSIDTEDLIGNTENPGAFARWSKISHFLVALREHQNKILRKTEMRDILSSAKSVY